MTAALVAVSACASRGLGGALPTGDLSEPVELTLISSLILRPPSADPGSPLFGSVSGLAWDSRSRSYLGVIDDRTGARGTWLDIRFAAGRLEVTPSRIVMLRPGPGIDLPRATNADLEAVVALADGTFVASQEGHVQAGVPPRDWDPVLLHLARDMTVTDVVHFPPRFSLPPRGQLRDNQGFEGLALTPDGRLVAALEQPLRADAPVTARNERPFSSGRGGPGRFVEFVRESRGWTARRQWMYAIEPTRTAAGFEDICDDGENGLSDLLALDDDTFLALERSCLRGTAGVRNTIAIYQVSVRGADDVSAVASLDGARVRAAAKRLVIDFDTLIPRLPPELANLENFEALAFGPRLPDGSRSLLVASDDNFRATQKTAFVLFKVAPRRN